MDPPPAPLLYNLEGVLWQDAQGEPDEGGQLLLYWAALEGGPYEYLNEYPWEASHRWADMDELPAGWLKATETGNNIVYAGLSEFSEAVWSPGP